MEQEDTESVQPGDQPQQQESGSSDLLTPPGLTNLQFLPDFMLSDEEVLKLQKVIDCFICFLSFSFEAEMILLL